MFSGTEGKFQSVDLMNLIQKSDAEARLIISLLATLYFYTFATVLWK